MSKHGKNRAGGLHCFGVRSLNYYSGHWRFKDTPRLDRQVIVGHRERGRV